MTTQVPARSRPNTQAAVVPYVEQVEQALTTQQEQLVSLLDGLVPIERFKAVVLHTIARNPDLQRASTESILDSIRVSATLKLEPTGVLGEGYLIRYGDKAQFEPGYRGLMKLARRSGLVSIIDAQVVYEHDVFEVELGTAPRIRHIPAIGERGKYVGVYAWARLSSGELKIEVLSIADVEKVRKVSRAGQSAEGPWVKWWDEMARKTALKRLMKQLPLGADAEAALRYEAETDEQPAPRVERPTGELRGVARARARLGIAPQPVVSATGANADAPNDGPAPDVEEAVWSAEPDEPLPLPTMTAAAFDRLAKLASSGPQGLTTERVQEAHDRLMPGVKGAEMSGEQWWALAEALGLIEGEAA